MLGNLVLSSLKLRISRSKTSIKSALLRFLIKSYLTTNTFSRKASPLPKASGMLTI